MSASPIALVACASAECGFANELTAVRCARCGRSLDRADGFSGVAPRARQSLRRGVMTIALALFVMPLVTAGLWLGSGREMLTKTRRAVEVQVQDQLFGDVYSEMRLMPGPVFGYYVGFDAVGATCAISALLLIPAGMLRLRRRQQVASAFGNHDLGHD